MLFKVRSWGTEEEGRGRRVKRRRGIERHIWFLLLFFFKNSSKNPTDRPSAKAFILGLHVTKIKTIFNIIQQGRCTASTDNDLILMSLYNALSMYNCIIYDGVHWNLHCIVEWIPCMPLQCKFPDENKGMKVMFFFYFLHCYNIPKNFEQKM